MKRILSMLLAVMMLSGTVGTVPVSAQEPEVPEETVTLMEEMPSGEVNPEGPVTDNTSVSTAEDDEEEAVLSTAGDEQEEREKEDTASAPGSPVSTEAESEPESDISETEESVPEEETEGAVSGEDEISKVVIEETMDTEESSEISFKPDGAEDPIFKTFSVGIDTSHKYTKADGEGFYIGMDSRNKIICHYEKYDGIEDQEIYNCRVTFTSDYGTMNFGSYWTGATPSYTTPFVNWLDKGIQIVRFGAGYDRLNVVVRSQGSDSQIVADGVIEVFQYGWESFLGAKYQPIEYSGRYYDQSGNPMSGWQKFSYDSEEKLYVQDDAGDLDVYFDPETHAAVSDSIYEISGKKYYFEKAQAEAVYRPYVLKKATADMTFESSGK